MTKLLSLFVVLSILLSGCAALGVKPSASEPTAAPIDIPDATEVPATEAVAPTESPSLLAPFFPVDDELHGRFANDALLPTNLDVSRCYRPWQAIQPDRNGSRNATWIALICDPQVSNADVQMFFTQPWELNVLGSGYVYLVIVRDQYAIEQLKARDIWDGKDPYDVSVAGDWSKQSDTLSIYFSGSGQVLTVDNYWVDMVDSFYQVPFAKDFEDGWIFFFKFGERGGNAKIWIGSSEYDPDCPHCLHSPIHLEVIEAD